MVSVQFHPRSLAFKLYGLLLLAVVSLVALAYAGLHFARSTALAAEHLSGAGLDGIVKASELEILVEQHRRIVEVAPAEVDRLLIAEGREALLKIEARIALLCANKADGAARTVAGHLPLLKAQASDVLLLAENFAQDKAQSAVETYLETAVEVQTRIREIRTRQLAAADLMVERLTANAQALFNWGASAVVIAVVLLGPAGLLVLGNAARRLKSLWRAMYRLAHNDIAHVVPSLSDIDEIGDMARAVQVFKDNAIALARQQGEIKQINGWLDIALENMARGLSMFDAQHRLVLCNESYRSMYDLPAALTVRGTPAQLILEHRAPTVAKADVAGREGSVAMAALQYLMTRTGPSLAYQTMADGRILAIAVQPLEHGGWVAVHEDVTRQREVETHIAKLAQNDSLTGLANRRVFREELERRCLAADTQGASFALMIVDLDRFKQVNDTHGHPAGDALLEAVAERLRGLTRAKDVVARLGGDEFAVLQDGAMLPDASRRMAERIIAGLSAPYVIDGVTVVIGASIGVALAPRDGVASQQLFGHADLALYHAKDQGRGTAVLFAPALQDAAQAARTLERDLVAALDRNEFELFYQPVLDLASQSVVSCEALLRWRHPTRGLVPPLAFIPHAEACGLIVPLGRWALERACRDAMMWPAHVSVAVNLSAIQVARGTLIADVTQALAVTGLAPHRLELEVTETLLLTDEPATRETLMAIRALGVRIALDDFGTGYASLSYLLRFPFDKLKIDQMFVRELPSHAESVAIVGAVAALARSLNMVSVAEGVETAEHLDRVAQAGCTQAQGYLFSKPVPVAEIAGVIAACSRRLAA